MATPRKQAPSTQDKKKAQKQSREKSAGGSKNTKEKALQMIDEDIREDTEERLKG